MGHGNGKTFINSSVKAVEALRPFRLSTEEIEQLRQDDIKKVSHYGEIITLYRHLSDNPNKIIGSAYAVYDKLKAFSTYGEAKRYDLSYEEVFKWLEGGRPLDKVTWYRENEAILGYVHERMLDTFNNYTYYSDKKLKTTDELPVGLSMNGIDIAEDVFHGLMCEYFDHLADAINPEKVRIYEEMVAEQLAAVSEEAYNRGEYRKCAVVFINCDAPNVLNQVMKNMGSTITEIPGAGFRNKNMYQHRQFGYLNPYVDYDDRWEAVEKQMYGNWERGKSLPRLIQRIWAARRLEMQRAKLDAEGRVDEPIYISDYPYSFQHTNLFGMIDPNLQRSIVIHTDEKTACADIAFKVIKDLVVNDEYNPEDIKRLELNEITFTFLRQLETLRHIVVCNVINEKAKGALVRDFFNNHRNLIESLYIRAKDTFTEKGVAFLQAIGVNTVYIPYKAMKQEESEMLALIQCLVEGGDVMYIEPFGNKSQVPYNNTVSVN
jgi:hypothetical protein